MRPAIEDDRSPSARMEWSQGWPLPFVAMIGISGTTMFSYSAGVLVEPMTAELGWTRSEFYSAVTVQMLLAMLLVPFVGRLVDRVGSRKVALIGSIGFAFGISFLSLTSGALWQWWGLNVLIVLLGIIVAQPVWIRPVVLRFNTSRGLAMAIALSGNGVATALWPVVAAYFVQTLGWRYTYPAMAWSWAIVSLPLAALWLFDSKVDRSIGHQPTKPVAVALPPVMPIIRTPTFLLLTAAGSAFSCAAFGLTLHFVPILRANGLETNAAAAIAALIGVFSVVGRIGTGALLDRFPTGVIGVFVFVLPAIACALLWFGGTSMSLLAAASVILGLAAGAEIDVITYVVAKRFDTRIFATVYASIIAVFSFLASMGPLLAGAIYDRFGSYGPFLAVGAILAITGAVLIWIALRTGHPAAGID